MLYQLNNYQNMLSSGNVKPNSMIEVENLAETEAVDQTIEQEEAFELDDEANSLKYIY